MMQNIESLLITTTLCAQTLILWADWAESSLNTCTHTQDHSIIQWVANKSKCVPFHLCPTKPAGHQISNGPAPVQSEQRDASSQKRSFISLISPSLAHHRLLSPEHQKPNYSNDNLRCICIPILAMCKASLIYFDFTKRSALTPKIIVPSLYTHTAAGRLSIVESRPEASHDGLQTGRPRRVWLGSFAISWFWKEFRWTWRVNRHESTCHTDP